MVYVICDFLNAYGFNGIKFHVYDGDDIGNESAFKYELCDLNCFDDIVNILINLTRC